jgi:hypothetical protein
MDESAELFIETGPGVISACLLWLALRDCAFVIYSLQWQATDLRVASIWASTTVNALRRSPMPTDSLLRRTKC